MTAEEIDRVAGRFDTYPKGYGHTWAHDWHGWTSRFPEDPGDAASYFAKDPTIAEEAG